eukprot:gene22568-29696_t
MNSDVDVYVDVGVDVYFVNVNVDVDVGVDVYYANVNVMRLSVDYPEVIQRTVVVETIPMSVSNAVDAIEGVGHDFYVFLDNDSEGALRVLYPRGAGVGFGLLIPKSRAHTW